MENATTLNTNYQIKLTTRNQHTEKGDLNDIVKFHSSQKYYLTSLNPPKYIDLHEQSILVISVLDAREMARDKD